MTSSPFSRLLVSGALVSLLLASLPSLSVADEPDTSIQIDQSSEIAALGSWTLQEPLQEKLTGKSDSQVFHGLPAGHYTVFDEPPSGTTAEITVTKNGQLDQTVEYPQVSFNVAAGDTVALTIRYKLTSMGRIGVNSVPPGIPFLLSGPAGLTEKGITPSSFDRMPVGNYSVQYAPDGCPAPPAKSGILQNNVNVYFSIVIECSSLKTSPVDSQTDANVSTDINGKPVSFVDVSADAWYAPYVGAVARGGILSGYRNEQGQITGFFGPDTQITVAELSKVAHQLAGIDVNTETMAPHNSQAVGKWFTRYEASAEDLGWVLYQNDHADLYRAATRGEVLITLLQALDIPLQWQTGTAFKDVLRTTPYAAAIETAYGQGLIAGTTDGDGKATGFFHPSASMNRAEMAKLIIAVQGKMKKSQSSSSM